LLQRAAHLKQALRELLVAAADLEDAGVCCGQHRDHSCATTNAKIFHLAQKFIKTPLPPAACSNSTEAYLLNTAGDSRLQAARFKGRCAHPPAR